MKKHAIDIEEKEGILFLRMRDHEVGPEQAESLNAVVAQKAGPGVHAVVINFSAVDYLSSLFLSALIEISKELRAKKVKFGLAHLCDKMLELLKVTKLDTVFTIFGDSYQAYTALAKKESK